MHRTGWNGQCSMLVGENKIKLSLNHLSSFGKLTRSEQPLSICIGVSSEFLPLEVSTPDCFVDPEFLQHVSTKLVM